MEKSALVLGSSGLIGSSLLSQLLENDRYSSVSALVRSEIPLKHPKLKQHVVDFSNPATLSSLVRADDVFCCLGTTQKTAGSKEAFYAVDFTLIHELAKLAKASSAEHFLLISSIGANPKSSSLYLKTKGQLEQAITDLKFSKLSIFRPSLLLGERKEFRFKETLSAAVLGPLEIFMQGPLRNYRPITARQVAKAMQTAANNGVGKNTLYLSSEIARM
ncbi:NAD(P)H-binding protein [Flexibacterium corallicola]|uniref:NAD(P)H-binding protein n=1 Tax=Flexibacterium corallicola TaxID=3037259 RepID=UPI00286F48C0|nr:NAD(P)H-binding protein [Pseudovibrio sp. M1P-2-3]